MRIINKIEPKVPQMPTRKKVAAYARVSMESERLQHSLSAQVSHYSDLIQKHPGWEYVGVYADNGITGTKTTSRQEFMRMLADCEAGKIDIILTKSISRFARNTVDLLETVRHLKDLGISVQFEKEHIDSMTEDGELMLTLLASFAQEESRSISENVKWGTIQRFKEGIPNGQFTIFGYKWVDDKLVVIPEEAEIVRFMYREYMKGASRIEIGRALMERGIYTRKGCPWVDSNVKVILTNITYTGNMLFHKEYCLSLIHILCRKGRTVRHPAVRILGNLFHQVARRQKRQKHAKEQRDAAISFFHKKASPFRYTKTRHGQRHAASVSLFRLFLLSAARQGANDPNRGISILFLSLIHISAAVKPGTASAICRRIPWRPDCITADRKAPPGASPRIHAGLFGHQMVPVFGKPLPFCTPFSHF